MTTRYSHLKAFRYPDRIEGMRTGKVMGPVHVYLILSDLCNQDCHFCAFRDSASRTSALFADETGNHNPNRMLPWEKIVEILDDCAAMGVQAIELTGGGEPTIHPHFADVVDAILARGMKWGLVTNGVRARDLSTASWFRVSLDAGTAQTYCKVRRVPEAHFRRACETIRRWKAPVSFVVTQENWHEIGVAAALVKSLGGESLRIRAQTNEVGGGLFEGFRDKAAALALEARRLTGDGFEVIDKFEEELREENLARQDYQRCARQYFSPWIGADQNLYRCCLYAYHPHGLLGSIRGRRFRDVWAEVYPGLATFDAHGCDKCRFGPMNRAVNEVLAEDPNGAFV